MDDDAIREIFAGLGPVSIRKMFGGKGIYYDGLIVGVEVRGELMIKGDAESAPEIEAAGGVRWAYDGKGRPVHMPYWTIPESALDDPDELAVWVRKAHEAALRAQSKAMRLRAMEKAPLPGAALPFSRQRRVSPPPSTYRHFGDWIGKGGDEPELPPAAHLAAGSTAA